jgi:aralkylamine N-acetyltransferase
VLVEAARPDGSTARIVYRTGGPVDVAALEALSEKVGWPPRPVKKVEAALRNSYLVASLHLQARGGGGGGGRGGRGAAAPVLRPQGDA